MSEFSEAKCSEKEIIIPECDVSNKCQRLRYVKKSNSWTMDEPNKKLT